MRGYMVLRTFPSFSDFGRFQSGPWINSGTTNEKGWKQDCELDVTFLNMRASAGASHNEKQAPPDGSIWSPVTAAKLVDLGREPPAPLLPAPRPHHSSAQLQYGSSKKVWSALLWLPTVSSLDFFLLRHFDTHICKLDLKIVLPLIYPG